MLKSVKWQAKTNCFAKSCCRYCQEQNVTPNEVTLLGAGLSTHSSTIKLRNRLHKLCHSLNKLSECEPHEAYWIVTRAAGSPTLTYLLKTSLCFNNSEAFDTADNELSTALSKLFVD